LKSADPDAAHAPPPVASWEDSEFLDLAEASAGIGVWDVDLATGMVRGRPQFFRLMGLDPDTEAVHIDVTRGLRHPEDRAGVIDGFQQILGDGTDYYESEYRIIWPNGEVRWILGRGRVVRDQAGRPVRYSGVDIDITERKRFADALRAAESRFLRVFQLAPIAMSISTLDTGRYVDVNAALLEHTGYAREEVVGKTASDLGVYVSENDFTRVRELLKADGSIRNLEIALRGKYSARTVLFNADVMEFAGQDCLVTASVDITDRKDADARQLVLLRELQHRAKNLLAVVQSIVTSSLRRAPDPQSAEGTILGRLHALARAQEFVAAGASGGAPVDEIVRAELSAFGARATMEGPPVLAGSGFAQMFAIVVHELATNAVKYGALSAPEGHVEIRWTVDDDAGFQFAWLEKGGPRVRPPASSGFGTQILKAAWVGSPRISFNEGGFAYEVAVPVDQLK
jgi:PAS domain S-box-containing protein